VAQHPHELLPMAAMALCSKTGSVFTYHAVPAIMTNEQTLVLYSGHPMGLPSHKDAPGLLLPMYDDTEFYSKPG